MFDLAGKLLINKLANTKTEKIDVSKLEYGVYTVKVSDSKAIKMGKLLKQ
ncbi:MAG: T9SS type A sorting domain-containing protein [Paludibacter sp.]